MELSEAVKIVEDFNIWRRGADTEMPNPTKIGLAIDVMLDFCNSSIIPIALNYNEN